MNHLWKICKEKKINEEDIFIKLKKAKAVSTGVADLLKTLKPKKKGPNKGNSKKVGSTALGERSFSLYL